MAPITAYEVVGTNALIDVDDTGYPSLYGMYQNVGLVTALFNGLASLDQPFGEGFQTGSYMESALNPALCTYTIVPYPAAFIPMQSSINSGVTSLTSMINATAGKFVMWGWSQGAVVTSSVYNEIRSGSLSSRNSDFLGGATFGNPVRQQGHTFPLCTDPGGEGIFYDYPLLSGTETRWFDFANPGDTACANDQTTETGQLNTAIADLCFLETFNGDQAALSDLLGQPIWTVVQGFQDLIGIFSTMINGPHMTYGQTTPLAPADTRTCAEIAVDYMHSLALGWDAATVAPTATTLSGHEATATVAVPTLSGTYTYTVNQYNATTQTASSSTLVGSPSISGGNAAMTVSGLTAGDSYTFSVTLGTTYSSPSANPTSMMSNSITAT